MLKLYIITRSDLPPGFQIAQSCHAAFQFAHDHRDAFDNWLDISNYLVILSASNEASLTSLLRRADMHGIRSSKFKEPDLGDSLTAVALEPGDKTKRLCRSFPLALK